MNTQMNYQQHLSSQRQVNIYSPEYARLNGIKPRATASARIRLGGVY